MTDDMLVTDGVRVADAAAPSRRRPEFAVDYACVPDRTLTDRVPFCDRVELLA